MPVHRLLDIYLVYIYIYIYLVVCGLLIDMPVYRYSCVLNFYLHDCLLGRKSKEIIM